MATASSPTLLRPVAELGAGVVWAVRELGHLAIFTGQLLRSMGPRTVCHTSLAKQFVFVGFESLPLVLLTAFFTGGVLALQSDYGLGGGALSNTQLGKLVALSMLRELGPVLAGLMLASRVGAAMAAELATMRVTEQIDALITLATNPMRYLVMPRVLACFLMLPLLVILANAVGIMGGWVVAVQVLEVNGQAYLNAAFGAIGAPDIVMGILKAATFGLLVGLMATYHGFNAGNGAAGVGLATTRAVVYGAVAILVSDYFITAAFL